MDHQANYRVAIIGAGPAGLFAARELASQNIPVTLINRDIKPGGLAEYGIYPDKYKMKTGLRAQFHQILALENIHYFGNLAVGEQRPLKLPDLQSLGFQAILVTAGAQATKWLGLPGENLEGVYHAKDLVYHYNRLPPFSRQPFAIGRRVAIVGAGNVMLDIARYVSGLPQVEEIHAIIRRGPGEIKFTRAELEYVAGLLDLAALETELERVTPILRAVGQQPDDFKNFVQQTLEKAAAATSTARFRLHFLASPGEIYAGERGQAAGIELEDNALTLGNGEVRAYPSGTHHRLDVDTVVFAIGDAVDRQFGLPVQGSEYAKNPAPQFPIEGNSYEIFDPHSKSVLPGLFVAGWARKASSGLVGVARKDGVCGARAVLEYLRQLPTPDARSDDAIEHALRQIAPLVVTQVELERLAAAERERARQLGLAEFKFDSNHDMLAAVGLT